MEKGKLIVSTKKNMTARYVVVAVCGVFLILMGILVIANAEAFQRFSEDFGQFLGIFIGICMICFPIMTILILAQRQRSFLLVYERCVEGTAISNAPITATQALFSGKIGSLESFSLQYSEILNIGEPEGKIAIYTKYAKYEVMAMAKRDMAIAEIRKRIAVQGGVQ